MAKQREGTGAANKLDVEHSTSCLYQIDEAIAVDDQAEHGAPPRRSLPPVPLKLPAPLDPVSSAAEDHAPPVVGRGSAPWPDAAPAPASGSGSPEGHDSSRAPEYQSGVFRRDLWKAHGHNFQASAVSSIGGRKVNFALRTGVAVALSCVYATHREVEDAEWQTSTVFCSVLAINAISGPSLGDTMRRAWELFRGATLGATVSVVVNEIARPIVDDSSEDAQEAARYVRKACCIVLFSLATFWALTRKEGIGFRRYSVAVMCVGIIKMSAIKDFSLEWHFPLRILVPCTVGPMLAVVAMVFPFPSMATCELRSRLAFQAYLERALLGEQYEALCNRTVDAITAADQLCETVRDNHARMKELAPAIEWELIFFPGRASRLNRIVAHFGMHLSAFRSMQATLRKTSTKITDTRHRFHSFTSIQWRDGFTSIAALTDEIVAAEQQHRHMRKEVVEQAIIAQTALNDSFEEARKQIVYEGASSAIVPSEMEGRMQEHCRRSTQHFFFHRLFARMVEFCGEDEPGAGPENTTFSLSRKLKFWWEVPSRPEMIQAIKKTVTLCILVLISYIDVLREENPQSIRNLTGCAFVFSDFAGSAFVTGMHRITGTLLSGAFALFVYSLLHSDVDSHDAPSNRFAISLVLTLWVTAWALGRTSPRYAYLVTVVSYSSAIMFVGALEGESGKHGEHGGKEVILFRMHQISLGVSVYVLVELLLWPKSARRTMNHLQSDIMLAMKKSLRESMAPYMSDEYSIPEGAAKHQHPPSVLKGKSLIGTSYKGVVAAQDEPQWNRPPFLRAAFERVLRTEARIFRILGSLTHASRHVAKAEVPEDVHQHVTEYVAAAERVLDVVCRRLKGEEQQECSKLTRSEFMYDPMEFVEDGLMGRVPQYWAYTVETTAPTLALERQDAKLRADMKQYYTQVVSSQQWPKVAASYSAQSMFFCLMKFTELMLELGERMRPIRSQEANPMHL